jgi:putative FmdB family regulatory protein
MPTYDYKCDGCGHKFEHFQSITASALKKCPECGKQKLKRLFGTGAGLIFKGSGFYQTDYRSDGYQKAANSDKPSSASTETKSEGSKESKPAAETKTETKTETKSEIRSESKSSSKKKTAQ